MQVSIFFWGGGISGIYAQIHIFKRFCPRGRWPWVLFYFSDINVVCANNSVRVTWRVNAELVPYAARLFLGNCMASQWKVLPSGEGEAQFNYTFSECKFTKMVLYPERCNFSSFHSLVYSNLITCLLSPLAGKGKTHILSEWNELQATGKAKPSRFCASYWMCLQKVCDTLFSNWNCMKCRLLPFLRNIFYFRPKDWIPRFVNPGYGVSEGHSRLVFHMALLNGNFSPCQITSTCENAHYLAFAFPQRSYQA